MAGRILSGAGMGRLYRLAGRFLASGLPIRASVFKSGPHENSFIGNAGERSRGGAINNVERKLANGFLRNGHSVCSFSDRDVARAQIFSVLPGGQSAVNAQVLERCELCAARHRLHAFRV